MISSLTDDFDPVVVDTIIARLDAVASDEGISIPWAIESGSRAWGFPSPDSDYDCRFLYVRRASQYLSPWRRRDVIETPLDEVFDVNGWDLIKGVELAVRGNVTVLEWLRSPLIYFGDPDFAGTLLALCERVADPAAVRNHYLRLGTHAWESSGAAEGGEAISKRVFYALRPALALRWMRLHGRPVPPMRLADLIAEAPVDQAVAEAVEVMVAEKAVTRELGTAPVPEPVRRIIREEFASAEDPSSEPVDRPASRQLAEDVFALLVERFGPTG